MTMKKIITLKHFINNRLKNKSSYDDSKATLISFTILTRLSIFSSDSLFNTLVEYHTGLSGTQDLSGVK